MMGTEEPMGVRILKIRMALFPRLYAIPQHDYEVEKLKHRLKLKEGRLQRKIENLNAISPRALTTYNGEELVPLLPFRLWLLRTIQLSGETIRAFADRVQRDEAEIRRWMQGIVWVSDCNPQPIHTVTLKNVDEVLTRSGVGPEMLNELYPFTEDA